MPEVIPQPEITREAFVGRDAEMSIIDSAISDKGHLRVVNIQGAGGIGKTSILCEVQRHYGEQYGLLVTEIIDFFDIATHTPRGFLDEVVRELSVEGEGLFEEYRKARDRADEIELAGITGPTLKDAQRDVRKAFGHCYNMLAAKKRIVLLIDTFEVVQHILGKWLAGWLVGLENTAVIIAGRRNSDWQDDLVAAVGSKAVDYFELKGFELEDTKELLALAEAGHAIGDEERQKLQILSEGRPILLILAVDREWPIALRAQRRPTKERTATGAKYTLDELKAMSAGELEQARKDFKIELVTEILQFMDIYPRAEAILYMAQVYKYLTADILAYLMDRTVAEIQELLDRIADWAFVKYDKRTRSYWLHDLIRELIMDHVWPLPATDPTGDERKHICGRTVKFYDDTLLADIAEQEAEWLSRRKQARLAGDDRQQLIALRQLVSLKRRRQHYEAQRVYYDIIADHEGGMVRYREFVFVDNVWAREREAYKLAQQERDLAMEALGLAYPDYQRKLEEARINIVREGEFDKGLAILEPLLSEIEVEVDPHLYIDILLYQGIAYTRKSEYEQAEEKLRSAIEVLKELEKGLKAPLDSEDLNTRRVARSLARACGNLGYGFMMAGRLSESIGAYREGLPYCKTGRLEDLRAAFLNDMAFAHARLGRPERARRLWQKGLDIRENLLYDYHTGLSYNTRGLMEYLADQPYMGKEHSQKALAIFERIGDPRGIGLAHRVLGALLGRIGQMESSVDVLREAEVHLAQAEKVFKEGGAAPESSYLADTCEKLGLLYCDWGKVSQARGVAEDIVDGYFERSEDCFERCIGEYSRGKSTLRQVTAIERLCGLYLDMGDLEKAEQRLKEMERIILSEVPRDYLLPADKRKKALDEIEFKRRESIYPLGKLERGKARLAFSRYLESKKAGEVGELSYLKETAKRYALACAYLELHSSEAYARGATLNEVASCIEELSTQEIAEFKKQVEVTQCEYGLEGYPAILEWIEDVIGVM